MGFPVKVADPQGYRAPDHPQGNHLCDDSPGAPHEDRRTRAHAGGRFIIMRGGGPKGDALGVVRVGDEFVEVAPAKEFVAAEEQKEGESEGGEFGEGGAPVGADAEARSSGKARA